jgi:prepilin-type N-terminal cleavage/methylation domain-containing protein
VNNRQTGFTLIEIAIVLVIIGLLLGGIAKGQETIVSARVRNLIAQQDGHQGGVLRFSRQGVEC